MNAEVGPQEGVRIANFLCSGNYAVSGGLPGCEARMHAPAALLHPDTTSPLPTLVCMA